MERPAGDAWASDFASTTAAAASAQPAEWAAEFAEARRGAAAAAAMPQQQQQQRDWVDQFADGIANFNLGDDLTQEQLDEAWAAAAGVCILGEVAAAPVAFCSVCNTCLQQSPWCLCRVQHRHHGVHHGL